MKIIIDNTKYKRHNETSIFMRLRPLTFTLVFTLIILPASAKAGSTTANVTGWESVINRVTDIPKGSALALLRLMKPEGLKPGEKATDFQLQPWDSTFLLADVNYAHSKNMELVIAILLCNYIISLDFPIYPRHKIKSPLLSSGLSVFTRLATQSPFALRFGFFKVTCIYGLSKYAFSIRSIRPGKKTILPFHSSKLFSTVYKEST